jgi:hypothetical protein
LVRPGLFFSGYRMSRSGTLKTLLAALALACLARTARAERAVGLEAQGVDPLAAIHNPHHLDVRDALGRPVSAELVSQQLGLAGKTRSTLASFASKLPRARLFSALAEFFARAPFSALSSPKSWTPHKRHFAAAPHSLPDLKVLLLLAAFLSVMTARARSTLTATPISVRRSHRKVDSLRC